MKITIFGLAGSGTSTVAKLLAEKTGYTFMSTGNIMREWAANEGMTIYDFEEEVVKHDPAFDNKLDNKTAEYGEQNNDFIFESRLAWHFIPDSYKIFIDCDFSERYRRIHEREGGDLQEVVTKNKTRESELVDRYKKVYPEITFPPKKEDFDLYIDTTSTPVDEVVEIILKAIR